MLFLNPRFLTLSVVKNEIFVRVVGDVKVNYPVHQIKTDKTDRKDDPGVFIDVRW